MQLDNPQVDHTIIPNLFHDFIPPARGKGVSNKSSALTRKIALLPFQQSCEVLATFGVSTGRWLCDTKNRKSKVRQNASWHRIYVTKFSQENRKACISLLSIGNGKRKILKCRTERDFFQMTSLILQHWNFIDLYCSWSSVQVSCLALPIQTTSVALYHWTKSGQVFFCSFWVSGHKHCVKDSAPECRVMNHPISGLLMIRWCKLHAGMPSCKTDRESPRRHFFFGTSAGFTAAWRRLLWCLFFAGNPRGISLFAYGLPTLLRCPPMRNIFALICLHYAYAIAISAHYVGPIFQQCLC